MSKSVLVWQLFFLNKEYLELVMAVVCYALLERGLWDLVEFLKALCFLKITVSTFYSPHQILNFLFVKD